MRQKVRLKKKPEMTKTSLMLGAANKRKLSLLKADLRLRGDSVTESEIVNILIGGASADSLTRNLKT